jgi:hypothetical protein
VKERPEPEEDPEGGPKHDQERHHEESDHP